jgi:hypothetical protein
MASGVPNLHPAARVYYGLHHPIQYNVNVKEIGYVPPDQVPYLISNWRAEDERDESQSQVQVEPEAGRVDEEQEKSEEETDADVEMSGTSASTYTMNQQSLPQTGFNPNAFASTINDRVLGTSGYRSNLPTSSTDL